MKKYASLPPNSCIHCNNTVNKELIKVKSWVTLFFIPIFPYNTKYLLMCPICRTCYEITKDQFENYMQGNNIDSKLKAYEDNLKYAGKTPTQINFLKQMDEYKKNQTKN